MSGAAAGAVAAAIWKASDPLLDRVFRTAYSDARLVGTVPHVAAGAAFGWAFARLGGRGAAQGAAAAVVENAVLWPVVAVVAPTSFRDSRAFARSTAGHALFGALLGLLAD